MPIFDQGYQHWDGKLSSHAWRWFTISARGARSQFKSRWVRLAILGAWIPAAVLATVLIAWGLIEQKSKLILPFLSLFHDLPESIMLDPRSYRVTIWTIAYQYFFLIEMFFSMILVLLVGPSLISRDIRFNAIPLYFSRPLRRFDYFAGKLGVIGFFLAAVAVVPALIAYVLGLCFSMDLTVVRYSQAYDRQRRLWLDCRGVRGHAHAGDFLPVAKFAIRWRFLGRYLVRQQRCGRSAPGLGEGLLVSARVLHRKPAAHQSRPARHRLRVGPNRQPHGPP